MGPSRRLRSGLLVVALALAPLSGCASDPKPYPQAVRSELTRWCLYSGQAQEVCSCQTEWLEHEVPFEEFVEFSYGLTDGATTQPEWMQRLEVDCADGDAGVSTSLADRVWERRGTVAAVGGGLGLLVLFGWLWRRSGDPTKASAPELWTLDAPLPPNGQGDPWPDQPPLGRQTGELTVPAHEVRVGDRILTRAGSLLVLGTFAAAEGKVGWELEGGGRFAAEQYRPYLVERSEGFDPPSPSSGPGGPTPF